MPARGEAPMCSPCGHSRVRRTILFYGLVLVVMVVGARHGHAAADDIEFNRDIRPILSENCFRCHGPSSASREAELRLDQRESAVDRGAIAPGKPEESELVRRIDRHQPRSAGCDRKRRPCMGIRLVGRRVNRRREPADGIDADPGPDSGAWVDMAR